MLHKPERNPSPYVFREALADDVFEISKMIHDSIEHFHRVNFSDNAIAVWKRAYEPDLLKTKLKERESLLLVKDQKVVGIVQFDPPQLKSVYLSPDQMGKGLGRLLMQEMLERLRQNGVQEVMLYCTTYVLEFYEKLGFINMGPVTTYWEGQPYEEFEMSKSLS